MIRWLGTHRIAATSIIVVVIAAVAVVLTVVFTRDSGTRPPNAAPTATTTTTSTTLTTTTTAGPTTTTSRPGSTTITRPPTTSTTAPTTAPRPPFPPGLRGQDVEVVPTSSKVVALTFDAGANSAGLPKILRALADAHVRATFFLTGNWARGNPAGVAQIVAAGHRVGNHTMTHPHMTGLSAPLIADEVVGAQWAIRQAGADPRPLFRFPFGERDARTIDAVNELGYLPIRWTVDTLGWKGTSGGITPGLVTQRVLAALRPGEIVLMHIGANPDDGSTLDADALPASISAIKAAGYRFVTLDVLLRQT